MKPIVKEDRRVANIYKTAFKPWETESGGDTGESLIQLNSAYADGVGFHVYRMAPGTTTTPHRHTEDEEFYVLEGELTDNDGTTYRQGDLVWLKKDTEHYSYSEKGCTLIVYIKTAEVPVSTGD
ncbi:MAG: cupin domain-containing protein [Thiolinea sp.]